MHITFICRYINVYYVYTDVCFKMYVYTYINFNDLPKLKKINNIVSENGGHCMATSYS